MSDITGGIVFYKEPDPERTQANRGEGYDETAQEAMLDACRKGYPMTCSTASVRIKVHRLLRNWILHRCVCTNLTYLHCSAFCY